MDKRNEPLLTLEMEQLWDMLDAGTLERSEFDDIMWNREAKIFRSAGREPLPRHPQPWQPLNDHVLS